ncbi:mitochondrial outer membrane protein IML2 [Scheffersomyces xylosifermentans]|uniref:mitochondrial outer membrane protein IML2 n=1 Tax=Scheffersomyces xylosifermentans TaxID=1304137 RepID=UPI00315D380D
MLKGLRKKASILSISSTASSTYSNNSTNESSYDKVLKQVHDFEIALQAMDYLLDDRTEEGTVLLQKQARIHAQSGSDQPAGIFPLALGVMEFIEATLGFEPEVMEKANKTLSEAETASLNNSKYNVKHNLATSYIYPPGTEFQVTYAESTLLNALVMLLKENNTMVEGAKALFKLRRAYQTLDTVYKKIRESEPTFNKNLAKLKKEALNNVNNISTSDLPGYKSSAASGASTPLHGSAGGSSASLASDLKLMKDLEKVYHMRKARIEGTNLGNVDVSSVNLFEGLNNGNSLISEANESLISSAATSTSNMSASVSTTDNHLHVSTVDEFIHSGVQLCFGILQVVLSLIPPAIGKVLSIVGFRGDRETGLKMLWRTAITSRNIHGELALLCLLVFYDGPVQFVDVGFQLPGHEDSKVKDVISIESMTSVSESDLKKILQNPALYTPQLLKKARKHFPHNALWLLQEGRVLAAQGQLDRATSLMQSFTDNPANIIRMQQVEALLVYDRAMFYAFQHDYDQAARDFIRLIDINSWSKGVYLYMAASCYLSKYRMIKMDLVETNDKEKDLKKYEDLANKYFELSPTYVPNHGSNATSKKQMPFDKFLLRKLRHIEARKKQYPKVAYVDLVGTSLIHELVYFWNGYNRMNEKDLNLSIKLLGYSGAPNVELSANNDTVNYAKIEESEDEAMIRYFMQSIALRSIGKVSEGLSILDSKVISKFVISDTPQFKFNKLTYSPYLYPTAVYEKAMFTWMLRTSNVAKLDVQLAVQESKNWLKKAELVGEGDYELSNRTGMRIKAAGDRLDQLGSH